MTKGEISIPNRNISGKSIPKLHTRCSKVLGSKLVRRVIPTRLVRTIVPSDTKSMCRPPPEPPDRQNNLIDKASKRVLPSMNLKRRPLAKPPDIHYANEERKLWDYRPPPKPPCLKNANRKRAEVLEKKYLPYRPPPKPPRMHGNAEERIWPPPKPHNITNREEEERKLWEYRPPPKPPYMQHADGEGIRDPEKKWLLDAEPNYTPPPKPPPEPPPKVCVIARVPRTR